MIASDEWIAVAGIIGFSLALIIVAGVLARRARDVRWMVVVWTFVFLFAFLNWLILGPSTERAREATLTERIIVWTFVLNPLAAAGWVGFQQWRKRREQNPPRGFDLIVSSEFRDPSDDSQRL